MRSKEDPLVDEVRIEKVISPNVALVTKENGRKDTVSTKHLAPLPPEPTKISDEVHEPMKNEASELPSDFAPSASAELPPEQTLSGCSPSQSVNSSSPMRTRYGRVIRKPKRYQTD